MLLLIVVNKVWEFGEMSCSSRCWKCCNSHLPNTGQRNKWITIGTLDAWYKHSHIFMVYLLCVCRCSSPCTSATMTSSSARFPSRRRRCAEMWWSSARSPVRAIATWPRCGEAQVNFQNFFIYFACARSVQSVRSKSGVWWQSLAHSLWAGSSQRCWIGLRSGLCTARSLWTWLCERGEFSCWNWKGTNTNCWQKVGGTLFKILFKISLYAGVLKFSLAVTKDPKQEKQQTRVSTYFWHVV